MRASSRAKRSNRKPSWDDPNRRLLFGGEVIREFRREAPGQMAVLAAFQKAGWPPRLDVGGLIPPGGKGKRWIRNTVKNLNRSLRGIHFHADAGNHAIGWGLV